MPPAHMYIQPPPEEFREVTNFIVPEVKPYYMISNYGRLWSSYSNRFLANNVDSKGYLYKSLARYNSKMINCRIHRLVMLAFCYIPGCEDLQINHIDGNKQNSAIWNLEWVTPSENSLHAWEADLRPPNKSKLTDQVAEIVCKLIMQNQLTNGQIAELCGISVDDVNSISSGRTHTNISSNYIFPQRKGILPEDKIRLICLFFAMVPRNGRLKIDYCTEALEKSHIEVNPQTLSIAERILYHQSFIFISKDYDF